MVMDSPVGAQIFIVPSQQHDKFVYFLDMKKSYSKSIEENPQEFRKYIIDAFTNLTKSKEDFWNRDLWVPNFSVDTAMEDSLSSLLMSKDHPKVTLPDPRFSPF
jgi:hypothetical protein